MLGDGEIILTIINAFFAGLRQAALTVLLTLDR
jgi:hypothetical protein